MLNRIDGGALGDCNRQIAKVLGFPARPRTEKTGYPARAGGCDGSILSEAKRLSTLAYAPSSLATNPAPSELLEGASVPLREAVHLQFVDPSVAFVRIAVGIEMIWIEDFKAIPLDVFTRFEAHFIAAKDSVFTALA